MTPRPAELPESEFDVAVRAARAGRFPDALDAAARVLSQGAQGDARATAAAALAEISRLAEDGGDLGSAERALDAALDLRPGYADLHFRRACLLLRGQRRIEARRALLSALAINPHYLAARLELAMLDAREGLVGEAIEALRTLSKEHAVEDPRAFQQGMRRLQHAEWDDADALLRRALHVQDETLQRELHRVRVLIDQQQAREAVSLLRSLVPRFAAFPDLHALLGRAELSLGHFDDAILALCSALELHPGYHTARVLLSHALEGLGQLDLAQEQIALVLRHDPHQVEALERRRGWSLRSPRGSSKAA